MRPRPISRPREVFGPWVLAGEAVVLDCRVEYASPDEVGSVCVLEDLILLERSADGSRTEDSIACTITVDDSDEEDSGIVP